MQIVIVGHAGQEQSFHTDIDEFLCLARLDLAIVIGCRDDQRKPEIRQPVLHGIDCQREDIAGEGRDESANDLAPARVDGAGGGAAHELQFSDGIFNAAARVRLHDIGRVQDTRDGRHGHLGGACNIAKIGAFLFPPWRHV